jgi:hypothetical protein
MLVEPAATGGDGERLEIKSNRRLDDIVVVDVDERREILERGGANPR